VIEEIAYAKWPRNVRLCNREIELIVTLDVGPRILRLSFFGGENLFKEYASQGGGQAEAQWMIRGGHRFWTAPEGPHCQALDNTPVSFKVLGEDEIEITQPPQESFGFQKTLQIKLHVENQVTVRHLLKNISPAPLALSPWALSVMAPGGVAFIPQPPLKLHPNDLPPGSVIKEEDYLPNRPLALWPYTEIADDRYSLHGPVWSVRQDAAKSPTKIGLHFRCGWVAYQRGSFVFAKKISHNPQATYPDGNSNLEFYTDREMLEIESLAPALSLLPGEVHLHTEEWRLYRSTHDLREAAHAEAFFAQLIDR
jgi:hypothetical protein